VTYGLLQGLLLQVWLPVALLVAAGGLWARFSREPPADRLRRDLNRLVIDVFAPPLLFALSAQATIDLQTLTVPVMVAAGTLLNLVFLYPLLFLSPLGRSLPRETRAAVLLAGMFGNVLFMGYPVLTFLYGPLGGSYAAFADVLATNPLLWTLGVWVATRLGHEGGRGHSLFRTVLRLPPVWGFGLGLLVNIAGIQVAPLVEAAHFMGQATIPLMLFTLGLSVPWTALRPSAPVLAAAGVKLVLTPLVVLAITAALLGPLGQAQNAGVLEVAMPGMVMAATLADRFGLDVRAAALTTGWTTLLFMATLPAWIAVL
jgi:hypothetical protein